MLCLTHSSDLRPVSVLLSAKIKDESEKHVK